MLSFVLTVLLAAQTGVAPEAAATGGGRILVVYYSRTGTTQQVAEALAGELEADIEQIQDVRARSGLFGLIRSGYEATRKILPAIKPVTRDPSQYGLVILGTPVWAGTMSSPMRSYITAHAAQFNSIALFSTHGGDDEGRTFQDMVALCGKPPVATLSLKHEAVVQDDYEEKFVEFVTAIRAETGQ
jgi:flavodoxin